VTYLLAKPGAEGLLEGDGEGPICPLGGQRRADAADGWMRNARQRVSGHHVRRKLGEQPAGEAAQCEWPAAQHQIAQLIGIAGFGRQARRLGARPRAV
jgi:hypothetical protein